MLAALHLVSRKLSMKRASAPEQKKVRTASLGRTTGGSPGRLNEVFTRMGAGSCSPKSPSNSHSKRFVAFPRYAGVPNRREVAGHGVRRPRLHAPQPESSMRVYPTSRLASRAVVPRFARYQATVRRKPSSNGVRARKPNSRSARPTSRHLRG